MPAPIISYAELKQLIDSKGTYVLIDVREKNELEYGMIPTAKNIPLSEFETAMNLSSEEFKKKYGCGKFLPQDHVIFYCRTGARSDRAAQYAIHKGFHAKNFKGSIWEWSQYDPTVRFYGPTP